MIKYKIEKEVVLELNLFLSKHKEIFNENTWFLTGPDQAFIKRAVVDFCLE